MERIHRHGPLLEVERRRRHGGRYGHSGLIEMMSGGLGLLLKQMRSRGHGPLLMLKRSRGRGALMASGGRRGHGSLLDLNVSSRLGRLGLPLEQEGRRCHTHLYDSIRMTLIREEISDSTICYK